MSEFLDLLNYGFMQNALMAGVLASVACGVIGTLVVVKPHGLFGRWYCPCRLRRGRAGLFYGVARAALHSGFHCRGVAAHGRGHAQEQRTQ